ncbi:MAG TPA: hypothetical protein DEO49_04630 [Sutterella sp.]|nr:hypothetical protein [Sutterella sp.]
MPARIAKSLDEFRVRPNLNFISFREPLTEAFSEPPPSSETASDAPQRQSGLSLQTPSAAGESRATPEDNPPASQEELDQKDLEACRRMFDSVEQALIEMGLSKPMSTDSKPAEATDRPEKQKTD